MRCSLVVGIGLVLAGCATDDDGIGLGRLEVEGVAYVTVPVVAAVGRDFLFEARTYGSSCLTAASTDVALTAEGATISLYDRHPGGICEDDLAPIEHHATLRFDSAGAKILTVRGWDADIEITVTVR